MKIQKTRKNQRFNYLIIKMYRKLSSYVFLVTKNEEITRSIVDHEFEKLYSMNLEAISNKKAEKMLYKMASEEIKKIGGKR